ncbi:MAG TPA: GTP cyclohydrolase II [Allosphingosinicella sp.]|nr:GTP cyclohydrolase II [Allosphingosinicella sp.]
MSGSRAVARAIDSLRRGWPVIIDGTAFLAIETAAEDEVAEFDRDGPSDLLITGNRAVTLKLANQIEGTPVGPVRIERSPWIDIAGATALADPALDLKTPLKGPYRTVSLGCDKAALAAIGLARRAGLLPAFFVGGRAEDAVELDSGAVEEFAVEPRLAIASRARLPIRATESAEIVAFRTEGDAAEHVALLIGSPTGQPPLVRLHSECLTGDVLGSLKCDCGPQLDEALAAVAAAGWGILLYLRQEGRGIGLVNKLRAYALQDQGFDTVDANVRLGFGDDERDFGIAAAMLKLLAQERVRLLTNNPRKVAGLEGAGVEVTEQVPLRVGSNPHNQAYLDTKRLRSGHQL